MKLRKASLVVGLLSLALSQIPLTAAQTTTEMPSALPRLVRLSGTIKDLNGNPLTGVAGVTFALYSEQTGGAALWLETQNVTADSNGHYVALLGSTKPDGLPTDLFTTEQARWVGVQVSGQAEQPRVLLVSAPYALKAGDAETIGGLPASAFVLANGLQGASSAKSVSAPPSASAQRNTALPANPNVTGKGVVDYIPMWNTTSDIVDSIIFQKSSEIGINTTTPAAKLDVNGKTDIRDTLTLFPKGTDATLAINGTAFKIDNAGAVTTPVLNATDANVSSFVGINSTAALPLTSSSSNANATSVIGTASTGAGEAWGVEGTTQSSGPAAFGVAGIAASSTGDPIGVYGQTDSSDGVGVFGQNGTAESGTGNVTFSQGFTGGVWGDGGTVSHEVGVLGTVDDGYAGFFVNNTASRYSIWVQNTDVGVPFIAGHGPNVGSLTSFCMIDHSGDLSCTGTKNAVVPIDGGKRTVAMSAIESPQNWFEDAGPGQLSDGKTTVALDPDYIQTVNTKLEYQVFLTPYGDCKGLYVTNRTSTSFEVHELGAGTANVSFGYRVMALRRNYENVRFADHTHDTDAMRQMPGRTKSGPSRSHSHKLQNSAVPVRATSVAPAPTTTASK